VARTERLIVPLTINEKKKIKAWAKEAKLNDSDYVRSKLSLPLARGKRNRYEIAPPEPPGDPENAVDVEELAKKLYESQINVTPGENDWPENAGPMSLSFCRKEAKRRLEVAAAERT
jgi:hypothetical protein